MISKIASCHSLSYSNKSLVIDGVTYTKKDFNVIQIFKDTLSPAEIVEAGQDPLLFEKLRDEGKRLRDSEKKESEGSIFDGVLGRAPQEDVDQTARELAEHRLVIDVQTGEVELMHIETQSRSHIPAVSVKNRLSRKEYERLVQEAEERAFVYSVEMPKDLVEVVTPKGPKLCRPCNTYLKPAWQFHENTGEELHEDHRRILEKRFIKDSFERYCYFLYYLITGRNKNITGVIHESQGTGKSTAFNFVPSILVGRENAHVARPDFLYKRFRDPLTRCRALIFEEFKLHEHNVPDLKALTEPKISVEGKNKAERTIDNTFSIMFTTNSYDYIYVEPGDRRWNILEDSGFHILNEYGPQFVKNYRERMENDTSFVANLGYWILNNFKDGKIKPDDAYRGESFERACLETMGYKDEVVETVVVAFIGDGPLNESDELKSCEADYITYTDLKRIHNKKNRAATAGTNKRGSRFISITDFESFFRLFRWQGVPICRVERHEREVILRRL